MIKVIFSVFIFIFIFLSQSCISPQAPKHTNSSYLQNQDIGDGVREFIAKLNNEKRLRRKRIALYLSKTRKYKAEIEQVFIDEKSKYRYRVIDRSTSDEIDFEHDISGTQDSIIAVDIVIKTTITNNNLNIKAQLLSNDSILAVTNIHIKQTKTRYREYKEMTYMEANKYCQNKGLSLPSLDELEAMNTGDNIHKYFWSSKSASGNEAYGFDFDKQEHFIGFMSDEYYVRCAFDE